MRLVIKPNKFNLNNNLTPLRGEIKGTFISNYATLGLQKSHKGLGEGVAEQG